MERYIVMKSALARRLARTRHLDKGDRSSGPPHPLMFSLSKASTIACARGVRKNPSGLERISRAGHPSSQPPRSDIQHRAPEETDYHVYPSASRRAGEV